MPKQKRRRTQRGYPSADRDANNVPCHAEAQVQTELELELDWFPVLTAPTPRSMARYIPHLSHATSSALLLGRMRDGPDYLAIAESCAG